MHTRHRLIAITMVMYLFAVAMAESADKYVSPTGANNPPYATWADAATNIQTAATAAADSETVWVTNGTYTLSSQLNIQKNITLKSVNGPALTIIDGNNAVRCLYTDLTTIDGFTFTNGFDAASVGVGVYCISDTVVTNCVISGNNAGTQGGGVYVRVNGVTLSDCEISGNTAVTEGGGVYFGSSATDGIVSNCTIRANEAGNGGGIYIFTAGPLVIGCDIIGNISTNSAAHTGGGGVALRLGGKIDNCVISENQATNEGGGVRFSYSGELTNCIVNSNKSFDCGGGISFGTSATGTVVNCTIAGNETEKNGGGIYWFGDALSAFIKDCVISNNTARYLGATKQGGGGIFCNYVSGTMNVIVDSCDIVNNWVLGYRADLINGGGGGIYTLCTILITNCVISGNTSEGCVGGMMLDGSKGNIATVKNCIISNNHAVNCGGVYMYNTNVLENCTVSDNTVTSAYAGVYMRYPAATMSNCVISGNIAGTNYGGIFMTDRAELINCLISDNTASNIGGGVYMLKEGTIRNCTIAGNNADTTTGYGSGLCLHPADNHILVENCIIYSNNVSGVHSNWSAVTTTYIHLTNSCSDLSMNPFGAGNITAYPKFTDVQAGNYRLRAGSPCINTGINHDWMIESKDLDGNPRLDAWSHIVDMGCYEHIATKGCLFSIH